MFLYGFFHNERKKKILEFRGQKSPKTDLFEIPSLCEH